MPFRWPGSRTVRLMPNCRNENSGLSGPYAQDSRFWNTQSDPRESNVSHIASDTFTTNQPSSAGARPEPESSSRASGTRTTLASLARGRADVRPLDRGEIVPADDAFTPRGCDPVSAKGEPDDTATASDPHRR